MNTALIHVIRAPALGSWLRHLWAPAASVRSAAVRPAAVNDPPSSLAKGSTWALAHPLACRIDCLAGSLWITHDGDPRDIVLEAGQSYRPDRDARLLAHALQDARLCVRREV